LSGCRAGIKDRRAAGAAGVKNMNGNEFEAMKRRAGARRNVVKVSQASLVKTGYLEDGSPLPLLIRPDETELDLIAWAGNNRPLIEAELLKHGAILFRGFDMKATHEYEQFAIAISGHLLEYVYGSTPRMRVAGKIYTSTEYPADQTIPMHNEMSYSRNWPMKIWFYCARPADLGGNTPIADSRKVFARLDPKVRERFVEKNVMYVRNYSDGLDLSWQDAFETADRSAVERLCREAGIDFEWKDNNKLKTRQVAQSVAAHPKTKESVWFNQAHLFHVSNVQAEFREKLLEEFKQEDLPRNAYYGDGSQIEDSVLDEIRGVYQQESISFKWESGDVLMLDNMLASHGREPFQGQRKILVAMAEPTTGPDA
jgi:alpha-ketoglutarate-dependent taurine dioxygenase